MKVWALLDCNNFFASCERVFRLDLKNTPIVVLSNNDGCIIARSNEVKELGVPMGAPLFKFKDFLLKHKVKIFSANFSLYGDLSNRVMQLLSEFDQNMLIYSIDEAFIQLEKDDALAQAVKIRKYILKCLGLPVSIGIGKTKTLAKVANHIAKKEKSLNGVFDLANYKYIDSVLASFAIGEVWGIGRQYEKLLKSYSINNAWDFKSLDDKWIRKKLNILGVKTAWELRGIPCVDVISNDDIKKGILSSRSFRNGIAKFTDLQTALASYVTIAAEKLRSQKSAAGYLGIFLRSKKTVKENLNYYNIGTRLSDYTAYTPDLITTMSILLKRIYKSGLIYKKAGIWLSDLRFDKIKQTSIFVNPKEYKRKMLLMKIIDSINNEMGSQVVGSAVIKRQKKWLYKPGFRSPRYTSQWNELPLVKC